MLGLESNLVIEGLLLLVGVIGLAAYPPQIIKLYKTKSSNDISVFSWVLWLVLYVIFGLYTFVYTTAFILFILYVLEAIACFIVLVLVFKYKK